MKYNLENTELTEPQKVILKNAISNASAFEGWSWLPLELQIGLLMKEMYRRSLYASGELSVSDIATVTDFVFIDLENVILNESKEALKNEK
jgi:hypothetical protein